MKVPAYIDAGQTETAKGHGGDASRTGAEHESRKDQQKQARQDPLSRLVFTATASTDSLLCGDALYLSWRLRQNNQLEYRPAFPVACRYAGWSITNDQHRARWAREGSKHFNCGCHGMAIYALMIHTAEPSVTHHACGHAHEHQDMCWRILANWRLEQGAAPSQACARSNAVKTHLSMSWTYCTSAKPRVQMTLSTQRPCRRSRIMPRKWPVSSRSAAPVPMKPASVPSDSARNPRRVPTSHSLSTSAKRACRCTTCRADTYSWTG